MGKIFCLSSISLFDPCPWPPNLNLLERILLASNDTLVNKLEYYSERQLICSKNWKFHKSDSELFFLDNLVSWWPDVIYTLWKILRNCPSYPFCMWDTRIQQPTHCLLYKKKKKSSRLIQQLVKLRFFFSIKLVRRNKFYIFAISAEICCQILTQEAKSKCHTLWNLINVWQNYSESILWSISLIKK